MGRAPCCEKVGLKKGRWTEEEDRTLTEYIKAHGEGSWRSLPKNAGLLRCGKSCRLRWVNYLREDLKRGNISAEEEETILKLQATLGNRWSIIAGHLPGRTDNEIKNYWNAHLSKKVAAAGTAAGEGAGGDGESGVREEINDGDGDDDGEVCSEDNGSTVVDADRDDVDDAADDSVDSMDVSSKATRKAGGNKRGGSVGPDEETVLKRKKKANKKRESSKDQPEEPMKEENEENNNINNNNKKKNKSKNGTDKKEDDDAAADGCRKRKKTCGGTDSCCDHICGSTNKKQKKERKKQVHASTVTHGESGSKEDVSNDSINKTQKKRRKVAKPANLQPGSTDTEPSSKQAIEEQAPCRPPSKLKTKAKLEPKAGQVPDADASTGAAACCHAVCGAPEEMGPLAHVEHVVESAEGGLLLEGPCHLEYTGMAVDLLEAIESDDAGLMPVSGGSMVSNENLLLDYFDMSCTDGACCTTGGLTPPTPRPCEDADSVVSGWPASPPMTLPPPSMLGEEAMFTSMGSFSTSSSCIDLVDLHLCADGCGNNTNAGTAVDDAIGSLPWEAEEDFWHILSEFAGDMDTAGPAPKEEEEKPPPCTSLHQPMTMMTQALHSNSTAGCRADDVLADDALENSWFLADMFLS